MRETLRRARAYGKSKVEQIEIGRISAKSGLRIFYTDKVPGGRNGRSAIVALDDGKMYVTAERKVITGATKAEQRAQITEFFNKLLAGNKSLEIETVEGDVLTITKAETAKKARDDYKSVGGKAVQMSADEFKVKLNAEAHIDELAEISQSKKQNAADTKNHSFAKDGFTYRTAYFEDFDGKYYRITLSIGHDGTVATIYNVGEIKESVPSSAKIIAVMGSKALDETLSDNSIPDSEPKSNTFDKKSAKDFNSGGRGAIDSSENVAWFDGKNTIYLDANAPRTRSYKGLLGHEVWHKMFKSSRIKALFNSALNNIDPGKRAEVKEMYIQHLRELEAYTEEEIESISDEEVAAAYAEELFNNPHVWDIVLDGEPTLKDKVLAFFKLAPKKYSFAPEMDPAAKEWIREYKKIFDQLKNNSELDPNNNTFGSYDAENADSDAVTRINQQNMQVSGRSAVTKPKFSDYDKPITLADVEILRSIGRKSVNAFSADELEISQKWAHKFYKELGEKSPFFRAWFGDWRAHDKKNPAYATSIPQGSKINTQTRTIKNDDTNWKIKIDRDAIQDSLHYATKDALYIERLLSNLDEVVEKGILIDTSVSDAKKSNKKGSSQFMHYLYAPIEYQGAPFLAKITIEEYDVDGKTRAYNAQRIKMSTLSRAQYSQLKAAYRGNNASSVDAISVADLVTLVKTFDKDFTPASSVNKALLNNDGTPKVFYHGTNAKFTEFSPDEIAEREGSYFFAENREDAAAYGDNVHEVYLSARNLADYDNQPREFYQLKNKREQVEWLKERGYDGWYADMDSGGWREVSVFSPDQIKSATDNIGTFSKYEKDIRYAIADGKKETSSDVAKVKGAISEAGIDPRGIMAVSDSYFDRYDGSLTRTGLRYEFLEAARTMLGSESDAYDRAFSKIEAIAEELFNNH